MKVTFLYQLKIYLWNGGGTPRSLARLMSIIFLREQRTPLRIRRTVRGASMVDLIVVEFRHNGVMDLTRFRSVRTAFWRRMLFFAMVRRILIDMLRLRAMAAKLERMCFDS